MTPNGDGPFGFDIIPSLKGLGPMEELEDVVRARERFLDAVDDARFLLEDLDDRALEVRNKGDEAVAASNLLDGELTTEQEIENLQERLYREMDGIRNAVSDAFRTLENLEAQFKALEEQDERRRGEEP